MAFWGRYVPVAERRAKARRQMDKLRKKGKAVQPVEIDGRTIARTFWGKGWCDHLESFSDYANRLPRGRAYVRNGSVCHLEILPGRIDAIVSGSALYQVSIGIRKLKSSTWKSIKQKCAGQIGSMLELLQGKLSDQVMAIVTDRGSGLFPQPGEIELDCSCPDWAKMCKHVAAVLYAVGNRLDSRPELLFKLREVDAQELIGAPIILPATGTDKSGDTLVAEELADIFGIDIDTESAVQPAAPEKKPRAAKRIAPKKAQKKSPSASDRKTASKTARIRKSGPAPAAVRPSPPPAAAPRPNKNPTGKSLARLRKQLGLTVAQFAARLGVTAASIYRWEAAPGRLKLQQRSLGSLTALQQQTLKK
jgi:uncharacterized Zn finger protein/DNA-binding XRE family transcriptional regulator